MARKKFTLDESPQKNVEVTKDETEENNLEEFLETMEDESPTPNEVAIAATMESSEENIPSSANDPSPSSILDVDGTRFDPAIHGVRADGSPSLTSAGRFRRKRGAGAAPRSKVALPNKQSSTATHGITDEQRQHARVTGAACAEMLFRTAQILGGDEWAPVKSDEHQIDERRDMQNAMSTYCEAKGYTDLPPGVFLAFTLTAYAAPRFTLPETKKRTKNFIQWIREKAINVAAWRAKRAARTNARNDGKRKDHASEKDSNAKETTRARDNSA